MSIKHRQLSMATPCVGLSIEMSDFLTVLGNELQCEFISGLEMVICNLFEN